MTNIDLINRFYLAFAAQDAAGMLHCYHPEVEFSDPAFGSLKGEQAGAMWKMLLQRAKGRLKVRHFNVQAGEQHGSAEWIAEYVFSQTGRPVVNHIRAEFEFRDGKIFRHTDTFDLGKWARQALGFKGWLVSIFPPLQRKLQKTARRSLEKWMIG